MELPRCWRTARPWCRPACGCRGKPDRREIAGETDDGVTAGVEGGTDLRTGRKTWRAVAAQNTDIAPGGMETHVNTGPEQLAVRYRNTALDDSGHGENPPGPK